VSAVPAYSDAVADFPWIGIRSESVDDPGDLVTGSARIDNSRRGTVFGQSVAVAHTTGLNFDSGITTARFGNRFFFRREISTSATHDYLFH